MKMVENVRRNMTQMLTHLRRGLPHITDQIVRIGQKTNQLQSNCETVKDEISEQIMKHIRELKTREQSLREDVDAFLVEELRVIETHTENREVELASLASFCDSAESVLSSSRPIPDGDLIEMKRQCEEHIDLVKNYEEGLVTIPNIKHIQSSLDSDFLYSTITNFGDLIITSRLSNQGQALGSTHPLLPPETSETRTRVEPAIPPEVRERAAAASAQPVSPRPDLRDQIGRRPLAAASQARDLCNNARRQLDSTEDEMPVLDVERTAYLTSNSRSSRSHRPSREERVSDPRAARRAPSQDMHSRSRHRSLGNLPTPEESEVTRPATRQLRTTAHEPLHAGTGGASGIAPTLTHPASRSSQLRTGYVSHNLDSGEYNEQVQAVMDELSRNDSVSLYVNSPRNRYNQKGRAVVRWGERGGEIRQFTWPRGVAVSPQNDNVFVSDSSNHRVQVFDSSGQFIKTFGHYGQGDGEFDCLAGIAVNSLGQIIIADRYNHRVQILDRTGYFSCSFGGEGHGDGQLNYPWGVACDNMGFIYVCDKENHRIQVFQSNGTFVRKFGQYGHRVGQFENPHYVAVSPDNKVYVSDSSNHRIQVFSIYGDFLFSFGLCGTLRGQLKFPRGLAIDHQGFVIVADSGNNRIQIFRADGKFYTMFGSWGRENGHFKGLEGVAILSNGNIVVSDRENHRIQVF